MIIILAANWIKHAKYLRLLTNSRIKTPPEPEEVRGGAGRESGVSWCSSASLQHGRLGRHGFFVAPKRAKRLAVFQAEASPQQAEPLTAVGG